MQRTRINASENICLGLSFCYITVAFSYCVAEMWISQVKTALQACKGHARSQKPRERKTVSDAGRETPNLCEEHVNEEQRLFTAWHWVQSGFSACVFGIFLFLRLHVKLIIIYCNVWLHIHVYFDHRHSIYKYKYVFIS